LKRGSGQFFFFVLAVGLAAAVGFWYGSQKKTAPPLPTPQPTPSGAAYPKDPAQASDQLLAALHQGLAARDLLKLLDRPVESSLEEVGGRSARTYRETYRLPRRWTAEEIVQFLATRVEKTGARFAEGLWREEPEGRAYEARFKFSGGWRPVTLVFVDIQAPRLALVIDDAGYKEGNDLRVLWSLKVPATVAVIPGLEFSTSIARQAPQHGWEVICHMPMEGHEFTPPGTYRWFLPRNTRPEDLNRILSGALAELPNCRGLNNHMGSRATEEKDLMLQTAHYLREKGLFFLDSRTSNKSVAMETMRTADVPVMERNVFLDNSESEASIHRQLKLAVATAKKKGYAVAIGHFRAPSLKALMKDLPEVRQAGVRFVYLSELVK
jgi:polysaccharide deacetylase 2 family uncharacterized protein YibQ